jgi:hypothetical protein
LETVDGAGQTFANVSGTQLRGKVGSGVGSAVHNGELHVFYNDDTNENLRWAMKSPGVDWHFETLDGMSEAPDEIHQFGPTSGGIRPTRKAVVSLGDQRREEECEIPLSPTQSTPEFDRLLLKPFSLSQLSDTISSVA